MVLVTTAIEYHLANISFSKSLSGNLAKLCDRICAVSNVSKLDFKVRNCDYCATCIIINDLNIRVPVALVNGKSRTMCRAADFLADSQSTPQQLSLLL